MITRVKTITNVSAIFENDVTSQFFCAVLPLVFEVKFFSTDKHPLFIIQITTTSACLDELRAFDILYHVFAL